MSLTINEIAKEVRAQLKAEFPHAKFSVRIDKYSGGFSLNVDLLSAPFEAIIFDEGYTGERKAYAQMNHYTLRQNETVPVNPPPESWEEVKASWHVTQECWTLLRRVDQIANKHNWDHSDIQSDYFDVNYYFHLAIGQWDRPFTNTAKETQ